MNSILKSLPGMTLSRGLELMRAESLQKEIVIRELVSPKYKGDRASESCRIINAKMVDDSIVLTVSYF